MNKSVASEAACPTNARRGLSETAWSLAAMTVFALVGRLHLHHSYLYKINAFYLVFISILCLAMPTYPIIVFALSLISTSWTAYRQETVVLTERRGDNSSIDLVTNTRNPRFLVWCFFNAPLAACCRFEDESEVAAPHPRRLRALASDAPTVVVNQERRDQGPQREHRGDNNEASRTPNFSRPLQAEEALPVEPATQHIDDAANHMPGFSRPLQPEEALPAELTAQHLDDTDQLAQARKAWHIVYTPRKLKPSEKIGHAFVLGWTMVQSLGTIVRAARRMARPGAMILTDWRIFWFAAGATLVLAQSVFLEFVAIQASTASRIKGHSLGRIFVAVYFIVFIPSTVLGCSQQTGHASPWSFFPSEIGSLFACDMIHLWGLPLFCIALAIIIRDPGPIAVLCLAPVVFMFEGFVGSFIKIHFDLVYNLGQNATSISTDRPCPPQLWKDTRFVPAI